MLQNFFRFKIKLSLWIFWFFIKRTYKNMLFLISRIIRTLFLAFHKLMASFLSRYQIKKENYSAVDKLTNTKNCVWSWLTGTKVDYSFFFHALQYTRVGRVARSSGKGNYLLQSKIITQEIITCILNTRTWHS